MSKLRSATKKESKSPSLGPVLGAAQDPDLQPSFMSVKQEDFVADPLRSPSTSTSATMDIKTESGSSPSQSPTVADGMPPSKLEISPAPTPPPSTTNGTTSKASTPPPIPTSTTSSRKSASAAPQLIGDLPVARTAALSTFTEVPGNCYQYKTLGRSREMMESMTCDCNYDHGVDSLDDACGPYSDCINRLTQVECLPDDCRCRSYCQNQRFQRREYADIEIVQTEKKGFGLRAESDILKDSFIYEYVGDVVNPPSFKKRMRDYASEGIQHFYFMMLQKDEFIDATKSGGIGRFANHSCSPNCYVAKWTIGNLVRMGIFAKRNIKKHEELTFNYNVDRYGHQAQICYCGEPNCVGYIGGKTQTDIVTMDDLYLDALGITDEADLLELKGSKKKKGKKIDDPDFMPQMRPIVEKDVPKVVQAIRQAPGRKVLSKLLTRIKITEDQAALRQIMRLRGYSLMTNVLGDHSTDLELIALALGCMLTWPLLNRNKVEDSKVIIPVRNCSNLENETVKDMAQKLLDHWETLPMYTRIPKRVKQIGEGDDAPTTTLVLYDNTEDDAPPQKRSKYEEAKLNIKPAGFKPFLSDSTASPTIWTNTVVERPGEMGTATGSTFWVNPVAERSNKAEVARKSVQAIIAAAAAEAVAAEAAATAAAAEAAAKQAAPPEPATSRKKSRQPKKVQTPEEKEANKEKRLLKLVGAVVVRCMSKYAKSMDHDLFKKHAKELTQVIADKEKKSASYKEGRLESLSDEKTIKIKKFAKDYIAKIIRKLEKSGKRARPPSSGATSSAPMDAAGSADGADASMADISIEDDIIDMEPESQSEGEGGEPMSSHRSNASVSPKHLGSLGGDADMADESIDIEGSLKLRSRQPSDPRRRPPNENREFGREPPPQVMGLHGVSAAS